MNNSLKGTDILSLSQFDRSSVEHVLHTAKRLSDELAEKRQLDYLKGYMASLIFFEPSTRTFSSFATAVKKMGGQTLEHQNPEHTSSAVKGETLEDTVRVLENYGDILIMRHPQIGAAKRAADAVNIPVLNAGDGAGEHPTQALLDMFTIYQSFGKLDNLTGLLAGDLLYGRTIHSLLKAFALFDNITLYLLAPESLKLPRETQDELKKTSLKIIEITDESEIPTDCNFWYWTRVQKERFDNQEEYESLKTRFTITPELLEKKGNKDMIIMHPLPRVGEIEPAIDADPRAVYLTREIKGGLYVRMALLGLVLGVIT
jgi:aspartate carbamoyltransferase